MAYPLFIHCYLTQAEDYGAKFFELYRMDHENRHRTELEDVFACKDRTALKDVPVRPRFSRLPVLLSTYAAISDTCSWF